MAKKGDFIPKSEDFVNALQKIFKQESAKGNKSIIVNSGELHRVVGGYPRRNHRMPVCCSVMKKAMKSTDHIISEPLKGQGASLSIEYKLPR